MSNHYVDFANGEKLIDKKTKQEYKQGSLYLCNNKKESVLEENAYTIFDDESNNVHLFSSDFDSMQEANEIMSKLEKRVKCFIECSDTGLNIDSTKPTMRIAQKEKDRFSDKFKSIGYFHYISIKIDETIYNLNFMRFYIDEDNKINCILGCPQFDRCIGKYVNKNGICYPHTADSEVDQLENIIVSMKKDGIKNYCYNPGIEELHFEKAADSDYIIYYAFLLAQEFMEFIIENESINVDNTVKYNLFLHGAKIPFYDYDHDITSRVIFDNRVGLGNYHLAPRDNYLRCHSANSIDTNLYAIVKSSLLEKYRCKLSRYGNYEPIYRFARIKTKTKYYDLMGFRMAKNNNGTVNCEMESYQFICADKNAFIDNKQKFKSWQVYPGSLEDGVETLPSMKNPCKNFPDAIVFYHNPKTKFISKNDLNKDEWNKSIEEIVKEFLDFIKVNEGA